MTPEAAGTADRVAQTRASFEYQWSHLPNGRHSLADEAFRGQVPGFLCRLTGLEAAWFAGRRVLDAGCGPGRHSFGFSALGARVSILDLSVTGVRRASEACAAFPNFTGGVAADLCRPLPFAPAFELVWSYGVLHHTGRTRAAFDRLADCVAPGGRLFVMLYGEPRPDRIDDYRSFVWLETWRRRCRDLPFAETVGRLRPRLDDGDLLAYFDSISPAINDRHTFGEVQRWFEERGFVEVERRADEMDLYVIGRRAG
jgi:SAM-dependent methyltransferase